MSIPRLESGAEGLLSSIPSPRLDAFDGLPVLEFRGKAQPWNGASGWTTDIEAVEAPPFGARHRAVIKSMEQSLASGAPRVFVVSSGSD